MTIVYDRRAAADIVVGWDVAVFADYHEQRPTEFSYDDPAAQERLR